MNIYKLIQDRYRISVGVKNENEQLEYIKRKIEVGEEELFLILPNKFWISSLKDIISLKEELFDKYFIHGIYDMYTLYYPYVQIEFSLFHFSKRKNNKVTFISLKKEKKMTTTDIKLRSKNDFELIKEGKYNKWYAEYLLKLERYIENNKIIESTSYIIFYEELVKVQKDKLYLDYYRPEYRENREKLNKEKLVLLSDIADITRPRIKKDSTYSKQLLVKDFKYPLQYEKMGYTNRVETRLEKNDIILSTHGGYKVYLYDSKYTDVVPTTNSLIIRLKDNSDVNIYYLYNYLSKEIAEKYFLSLTLGNIINYIRKVDVESLPIIIPKKEVLDFSKEEFRLISNSEAVKLLEINKIINKKWHIDTPIQMEIMAKLLSSIKNTKYKKIKEIIEYDLLEINKCIGVGAYKASIIMCGSVLEGVLIDWISETNQYIENDKDKKSLYELIESFKEVTRENHIAKLAHQIRKQRNSVHPKLVYQEKIEFNKEMAMDTIYNLKIIVNNRFEVDR